MTTFFMLQRENQRIMHGSIWLVTMPHPRAHPRKFAIFLFPSPGHKERDNSPPPTSWSTSYTFFGTSLFLAKAQRDVSTIFIKVVEFIERRILWMSKTKRNWTLKRAPSLWNTSKNYWTESLCICFRPFSYKFAYYYLKLGWRNISVQKN